MYIHTRTYILQISRIKSNLFLPTRNKNAKKIIIKKSSFPLRLKMSDIIFHPLLDFRVKLESPVYSLQTSTYNRVQFITKNFLPLPRTQRLIPDERNFVKKNLSIIVREM